MRYDHIYFMELVASSLSLIGHLTNKKKFFRISGVQGMEEVLQNMGQITSVMLLAEDEFEGDYQDAQSDNTRDIRNFMFYIVKKPLSETAADRHTALSECEEIRKEIVAMMLKHRKQAYATNVDHYGLKKLIPGSISYFSLGPVGDGFYGIACGFQTDDNANLVFHGNLWNLPVIT